MNDHDPLCKQRFDPYQPPCPECEIIATARADEREQRESWAELVAKADGAIRADLRAKVQKLHEEPYPHIFYGGEPTGWRVALNKVLILIDAP